ncbi:hypothetical protein EYF80_066736 [Liparis tanakae]|uniref:Uncharacterized protein n=1 Tax=Liparis tanakae TaxID=230148 RepID=A0A4Z2E2L0_9TELE|nr:hypothetical protein EYF80_066736 [Liparis tanakae]
MFKRRVHGPRRAGPDESSMTMKTMKTMKTCRPEAPGPEAVCVVQMPGPVPRAFPPASGTPPTTLRWLLDSSHSAPLAVRLLPRRSAGL